MVTSGAAGAHAYDGNLKRVREHRSNKTIYTIYSKLTGGLIYRDEVTDATTTDYVTAGGAALRLRRVSGGAFDPEYSHFDAQGSVVAATNPAGTARFREQYNPFGEERLDPAANDNDTGYTGHLMDDATGLVYIQARYYDPIIGRFLSTDPIGYQDQLNLYAYVHNDPVNNIDPNGEERYGGSFTIKAAIGKFGFKISIGGSFDTESKEIGASVTVGYRAGAQLSAKAEGYVEPSSVQGNEAAIEGDVVVEGAAEIAAAGKVGVSGELSTGVKLSTKDGLTGKKPDFDGGVSKGAISADENGRKTVSFGGGVGVSGGADVTLSANVALEDQPTPGGSPEPEDK